MPEEGQHVLDFTLIYKSIGKQHWLCVYISIHKAKYFVLMHLSVEFILILYFLRGPQTQRSVCCVCQRRTRASNRVWVLPRASCSSCLPSPPTPAPCSSRWGTENSTDNATEAHMTNCKQKQQHIVTTIDLCLVLGEWEPPEQSAAARNLTTTASWAVVAAGASEWAKWVEERRGAEETRGASEGAAAGAG